MRRATKTKPPTKPPSVRPLVSGLLAQPWAMEPRRFEDLAGRLRVVDLPLESFESAARAQTPAPLEYDLVGSTAVVAITGIVMKSVPWWMDFLGLEATGTEAVRDALESAIRDPQAKAILLYVDSPGGTVAGVQELVDAVFAARQAKPLDAHISDLGASAAYWIASQARGISANETAEIGSIGVYATVLDTSKAYSDLGVKVHVVRSGFYKGSFVDGKPIDDAELVPEQETVDGLARSFVAAVARGRGRSVAEIARLATGRAWLAPEARALGLIDTVENLDETLARSEGVERAPDAPTAESVPASPPMSTPSSVSTVSIEPREAGAAPVPVVEVSPMPDPKPETPAQSPAPAQPPVAAAAPPEVKPDAPDPVVVALAAERERAAAINEAARNASMPEAADDLIRSGVSVAEAKAKLLDLAVAAGKFGGAPLNTPGALPPEPDPAQAKEKKARAEYDKLPESVRSGLTFDQWKEFNR